MDLAGVLGMQKRQYLQALACFLAIPAVLMAEGIVFGLLDPEMARSFGDYTRYYRLIEMVRAGTMMGAAGIALALWILTCYLVLKARQRSFGWLALAAGGPIGFQFIAMLKDRAPAADDCYQQFIGRLKTVRRVLLEIALFMLAWVLAFASVALKDELLVRYESFATGTPAAVIIERQNAESGMRAFSDGLQEMYLVVLVYLLWPIAFNLVGQLLSRRAGAAPKGAD